MNYETAELAAHFELEAVNRRAALLGALGQLPSTPPLLPMFRRRAMAIPAAIEIRHGGTNEKARVAQPLHDATAQPAAHADRKAS